MRKAAIEAVAAMVQDEEDALALEAFLGHFRGRIVETGSDREAPVCLAALHLLHLLLQHGLVSLQQLLPVMRCAPCPPQPRARARGCLVLRRGGGTRGRRALVACMLWMSVRLHVCSSRLCRCTACSSGMCGACVAPLFQEWRCDSAAWTCRHMVQFAVPVPSGSSDLT